MKQIDLGIIRVTTTAQDEAKRLCEHYTQAIKNNPHKGAKNMFTLGAEAVLYRIEQYTPSVIAERGEPEKDFTKEILTEIYKAFYGLGAKMDLLSIIGSYKDTQSDEEILDMLKHYNSLNKEP